MNREQFIATPEDKLVTVRIVSEDGAFNRLLNTIPASDGASFQCLDQDLSDAVSDMAAAAGMTVKLPESKRATIASVARVENGVSTVGLQFPAPPVEVEPQTEAAKPAAVAEPKPKPSPAKAASTEVSSK